MSRATTVRLDLGALVHNLQRVRAAAPGRRVATAVKAEGYGHGLLRVARSLDADAFAVACIEEALTLREAGIDRLSLIHISGAFRYLLSARPVADVPTGCVPASRPVQDGG